MPVLGVVGEVYGEVVELAFEGAVAEGAVFVELVGVPALATDNLVTRHRLYSHPNQKE